ncbi:NEAT domain-containing protein [Pseudogracilibacillus auburnensis]|uniref:NEAT domain-containing protein n=1 Tax=Pseudogracilibacillus auburnensis TaxID=1494959 RepID=UPI001A959027|nr:NEAT domain-containing protein [Pseudogracilibacillus auburnensis]MBO1004054.1 NEAT domain-containing protein [Pseudogracilibacillus auburnensis]
MEKKTTRLIGVCMILYCICTLMLIPVKKSFAETSLNDLEDGAYSIEYDILHAENDSVSIANDYFDKPATLYVENGEKYIQFHLNHSYWIKELQAPLGDSFVDVGVVSADEEDTTKPEDTTRVIEFLLDRDLTDPLEFKMHVLIETMDPVYDNHYTVRYDFDESTIEPMEDAEPRQEPMEQSDNSTEATEDDDEVASVTTKADDESSSGSISVTMIIILVVATALFIYILWKMTIARRKNA